MRLECCGSRESPVSLSVCRVLEWRERMKSPKKAAKGVRSFIGDVSLEMKKSTWPTRQELMESTVVVIVSILILGVFVGVSDWLLIKLLDIVHMG